MLGSLATTCLLLCDWCVVHLAIIYKLSILSNQAYLWWLISKLKCSGIASTLPSMYTHCQCHHYLYIIYEKKIPTAICATILLETKQMPQCCYNKFYSRRYSNKQNICQNIQSSWQQPLALTLLSKHYVKLTMKSARLSVCYTCLHSTQTLSSVMRSRQIFMWKLLTYSSS